MAFVYSCCFWFSLRLGGILIGIFSLLQGFLILIAFCLAHTHAQEVSDEIANWLNNMKLIFTKDYLENIKASPEKYISLCIVMTCIYIIICLMYIYGAYVCNNVLMIAYILGELLRLTILSTLIIVWLLVLKQNTMDIGLLIGASVGSGFFLLAMFYLWVCAANLPVLINEMERDEQAAMITTLQQLLEKNSKVSYNPDNVPLTGDPYRKPIFTLSKTRIVNPLTDSRGSLPYCR